MYENLGVNYHCLAMEKLRSQQPNSFFNFKSQDYPISNVLDHVHRICYACEQIPESFFALLGQGINRKDNNKCWAFIPCL